MELFQYWLALLNNPTADKHYRDLYEAYVQNHMPTQAEDLRYLIEKRDAQKTSHSSDFNGKQR